MPEIVNCPEELQKQCLKWKRAGQSVGVVPTMGALHEGHLSLVKHCSEISDRTVVTVFVNPTQFGPNEDFERYPRDLDADLELLKKYDVDIVFSPTPDLMYPDNCTTTINPPKLSQTLEGELRPGHFQGVVTVVLKLLNLTVADFAVFGQKDFQQLAVIGQMCKDLNVSTEIIASPIVREPDGLALSSRNRYLDSQQRKTATALSQALFNIEKQVSEGQRDARELAADLMQNLIDGGVDSVDYAVIADAQSLQIIETIERTAVALVAAYVGNTRLIDNCLLTIR